MNTKQLIHTPAIAEHASLLLEILQSWGSDMMTASHTLEGLIREGFDVELSSSTRWGEPEHGVVLAIDYIGEYEDHSGQYRDICAGMTAELLASIPDLAPDMPWDPENAAYVPFSERSYVQSLLNFAAHLGKDPALFESLYDLIENPQLKAEKGGVALLTHLIPSLIATQTDRRFQPIWDDMLNKRPAVFNGYFTGSFYDGFRGLCELPPLDGDTDGVPADILPYAFNTLVMMIDPDPQYDNKTSALNRELVSLYERFPEDALIPVVQPILDHAPAQWPGWAKELALKIADRHYVPLDVGAMRLLDYEHIDRLGE